eukprot:4202172-Prymnesium_polylepis.1
MNTAGVRALSPPGKPPWSPYGRADPLSESVPIKMGMPAVSTPLSGSKSAVIRPPFDMQPPPTAPALSKNVGAGPSSEGARKASSLPDVQRKKSQHSKSVALIPHVPDISPASRVQPLLRSNTRAMMGDDGPERFGAQMKRRNGSLAPGRAASIAPGRKLTLKVTNAPVDLADDEPLLEIPPMIALRHYDDWPSETITAMEIFEDKHRRLARATETLTVSLGGPQLTSASYADAVILGLEEVRRNRFFVDEVRISP